MADGFFPTLVSATRDANSSSNPIFSQITDGTDLIAINADGSLNITDNGGSLTVDGTVTVTATDLDIRDLSATQDNVAISDGTDTLAVNADGSINVVASLTNDTLDDDSAFTVGTSKVYPMGALADETTPDSVDEGDIGAPRMTLDRKLLTRVVGASDANRLDVDASGHAQVDIAATSVPVPVTDNAGSLTVDATDLDIRDLTSASDSVEVLQATHDNLNLNANIQVGDADVANGNPVPVSDAGGSLTVDGTVTVTATDLDIRDLTLAQDSVKVSANTSANSETNPIFVKEVTEVASANEVHSYNTASAVAADATNNHDYTVTGTTLFLKSIILSSSGDSKVEVQTGPVASLTTKAVGFIHDGGTLQLNFNPPIEVPSTSTGTVRLIRTNRENQTQDLYSTIIGNDVA